MQVLVCIGCSVVASVITTKILATHYFDIVNGYVDDVCNRTKGFVQEIESMMCKCQQKDEINNQMVMWAEKILRQPEELSKEIDSLRETDEFIEKFIHL